MSLMNQISLNFFFKKSFNDITCQLEDSENVEILRLFGGKY